MKKLIALFSIIIACISINSCIPGEEMGPVTGRRGFCFRNQSSSQIKVLHIAANVVVMSKDITSYLIAPNEEKVNFEQTDCDINEMMWLDFNRDFDTIKVFSDDKLIKLWHGPLTNNQTDTHTPYEVGDWERIDNKDTTILRFTFTDKDFE